MSRVLNTVVELIRSEDKLELLHIYMYLRTRNYFLEFDSLYS